MEHIHCWICVIHLTLDKRNFSKLVISFVANFHVNFKKFSQRYLRELNKNHVICGTYIQRYKID